VTTQDLIAEFEGAFLCCVGPPLAFFEIEDGRDGVVRLTYTTYALAAQDEDDAEDLLVQEMRASFGEIFATLGERGRTLFWRYPERIILYETQERQYGAQLVTAEAADDGAPIPTGAIYHPLQGCWCEDLGVRRIASLRTRLVIPAAHALRVPASAKTEGATTRAVSRWRA